jgi:hypothetical protein
VISDYRPGAEGELQEQEVAVHRVIHYQIDIEGQKGVCGGLFPEAFYSEINSWDNPADS